MALLLAGVRTVCRWPTFTMPWCYTSCLVGMRVLSSKHFSVWVTSTQCEFQCVLCTACHFITTACCCMLCPENS